MNKIHFSFLLLTLTFLIGAECLRYNKKYNDSCETAEEDEDECTYDSYKGFKCHPELRVCRCYNETSMFYDEEEETCFVNDFGSQCIYEDPYNRFQCNSKQKLSCDKKTNRCGCSTEYLPSSQNSTKHSETKCLPAFPDKFCSDSMPCHENSGLVCSGGYCKCPRPLSQTFNEFDEKRCVGLPETINGCDPKQEGSISQCVKNSYCGEDGKCHCKIGYAHEYGYHSTCRLGYSQACNMTQNLNNERWYENGCSFGRGFRCRDGICGCNDAPDTQYDPVQNVCAITEGHFCRIYYGLPCLTGLKCKSKSKDDPSSSTCEKISDDTEEGNEEGDNKNQTNK